MARRTSILFTAIALATVGISAARAQTTTSYTYDALGRVVSAYYPDGTCLSYAYDAAGNRTEYTSANIGAPVANPVSFTGYLDLASTFDPRINDPVCGTLTVSAVGTPSHGTATIVSGGTAIIYTPNATYTGTDSFTYKVTDGSQTSPNGTVTATVLAPTLTPVALSGSAQGVFFAPVTPSISIDVTPLISDPYGYAVPVSGVTQGSEGQVTYSGNTITYLYHTSVRVDETIDDKFTYSVKDPQGNIATATVAVSLVVIKNQ